MDTIGVGGLVVVLGSLIYVIGWIWMIIIGFQQGGALWGILIFFFSWVAGIVFCIMHKTGWVPLVMMLIGGVLAGAGAIPMVLNALEHLTVS